MEFAGWCRRVKPCSISARGGLCRWTSWPTASGPSRTLVGSVRQAGGWFNRRPAQGGRSGRQPAVGRIRAGHGPAVARDPGRPSPARWAVTSARGVSRPTWRRRSVGGLPAGPGRHRAVAYWAGLLRAVDHGTATAPRSCWPRSLRRMADRPRPRPPRTPPPRAMRAQHAILARSSLRYAPVPMTDAPQWYVRRRVGPARPTPAAARGCAAGDRLAPRAHRWEYKAPKVADPAWLAFVRGIRRPSDGDWSQGPALVRCTCKRTPVHLVQWHRRLLSIVPRTPQTAPVYPSVPAQPCACCGLTVCNIRRGVRPEPAKAGLAGLAGRALHMRRSARRLPLV